MSTGWHINLLTLFPEMFPGSLGQSLSGRALEKGSWSYRAVNIRDFATDKHKTVDDTPFGGGAGMVMRPDVIEKALLSVENPGRRIYLSPRGKVLTQDLVKELAAEPVLTLLCGRYEGVDQRLLDAHEFEEISIGDYVLSGGEPAALILMDACIRLLPGVMGNETTPDEESFSDGLLEYPHYTRPADWTAADGKTRAVPDVLTSGDHGKVAQWRRDQARAITRERRPELIKNFKRFYVSHSSAMDVPEFYKGLTKAFREILPDAELILPHARSDAPYPARKLFENHNGDLAVIAEVSDASTGSGIELGWAQQNGVPVIGFYRAGTRPSSSVKNVTGKIYEYTHYKEIARAVAAAS